jgi:hypothetical protein
VSVLSGWSRRLKHNRHEAYARRAVSTGRRIERDPLEAASQCRLALL